MTTVSSLPETSLRERALAAKIEAAAEAERYEQRQAEKERATRTQVLAAALKNAAGWLGEMPTPTAPRLTVDGITFGAWQRFDDPYGHPDLYILGDCPVCGEETSSENLTSLGALGAALENFQPACAHRCMGRPNPIERLAAQAPTPTTADQLLALIRDLIREEVGNRE